MMRAMFLARARWSTKGSVTSVHSGRPSAATKVALLYGSPSVMTAEPAGTKLVRTPLKVSSMPAPPCATEIWPARRSSVSAMTGTLHTPAITIHFGPA